MKEKENIIQIGNIVLRKISTNIPAEEITSSKIQSLILKMKECLENKKEGVALAAPQIGESLRIFIISPMAYLYDKRKEKNLVFINPKIVKFSKKKKVLEEGCLSVHGKFGKVERFEKMTLDALDENGKKFTQSGTNLIAQIFQHEIDHLDGILFVDKAKSLGEL